MITTLIVLASILAWSSAAGGTGYLLKRYMDFDFSDDGSESAHPIPVGLLLVGWPLALLILPGIFVVKILNLTDTKKAREALVVNAAYERVRHLEAQVADLQCKLADAKTKPPALGVHR